MSRIFAEQQQQLAVLFRRCMYINTMVRWARVVFSTLQRIERMMNGFSFSRAFTEHIQSTTMTNS